ncbi:MAG: NYN domain-containing protein [Candidatus Aminicenantes bacterium]|nr:NYN domain-containing protein [Candidatus Aminicenantes bacterium]
MPSQQVLLIDGYNVINRVPELKAGLDEGLESARNKLAVLISRWSQRHPAVECVIIFDGDIRFSGGRDHRLAGIRCIFSRTSHGGDDAVIRFVREYRGRTSDITVVSDDNYVRNNCRAHGASVKPSSFIMSAKKRPSFGGAKSQDAGKGIDRKTAAEIDRELMRKFGL